MNHALRVALCHSATARAHLAGAETAELWAEVRSMMPGPPTPRFGDVMARMCAARRRYWRELAAVQLLMGHRWEQAEALGVEPNG